MALGQISVGCDPELFLKDVKTGQFVSAYGLLPGTKKEPYPVKYGAVQIDGMATEFNIDPATSVTQFDRNISSVIEQMKTMLPPTVELTPAPTAVFDAAYFKAQPDKAKEMGCDPDLNAYTGKENKRPETTQPMRTAGGHVHVGFTADKDITDPDHVADCIEVVKQLDYYLGVPSLLWDDDHQRRSMYGAPGAFRIKSYGVEYRSLSCMWAYDATLRAYIFNATVGAVQDLYSGKAARLALSAFSPNYIIMRSIKDGWGSGGDYLSFWANHQPFFKSMNIPAFIRYCEGFRYRRAAHKVQ